MKQTLQLSICLKDNNLHITINYCIFFNHPILNPCERDRYYFNKPSVVVANLIITSYG